MLPNNFCSAMCSRELGVSNSQAQEIFDRVSESRFLRSTLTYKTCKVPPATKAAFLIAFSPDGKHVASSHGDHNIYVCDVIAGRFVHCLTGHKRTPWALAYHPGNSDLLASGCLAGEVRVWDLKTGYCELLNVDDATSIASLSFHPYERLLAIATANRLLFWDWGQKYPCAERRTANAKERVRYVHFDLYGHLYTGITNVAERDQPSNGSQTLTPPPVMPYRCRELLESRSELIEMRTNLSRRHDQLLRRYNELLRRYRDLREQYQPYIDRLEPIDEAPSAAEVTTSTDVINLETYIQQNEDNRRFAEWQLRSLPGTDIPEFDTAHSAPPLRTLPRTDTLSPIALEGLQDAVAYARDITNTSMQQFMQHHRTSVDRLQRSYIQLADSAQRLVSMFEHTYRQLQNLQDRIEDNLGRQASNGAAPSSTTSGTRHLLAVLTQLQTILLRNSLTITGSRSPSARHRLDVLRREVNTMREVHESLFENIAHLNLDDTWVHTLTQGRDRVLALSERLQNLNEEQEGQFLAAHRELGEEVQHFQAFISNLKRLALGPDSDVGLENSNSLPVEDTAVDTEASSVVLTVQQQPETQPEPEGRFYRLTLSPSASVQLVESPASLADLSADALQTPQPPSRPSPVRRFAPSPNITVSPYFAPQPGSQSPMLTGSISLPSPLRDRQEQQRALADVGASAGAAHVINLSPTRVRRIDSPNNSGRTRILYQHPFAENRRRAADDDASSSPPRPPPRKRIRFDEPGQTASAAATDEGPGTSAQEASGNARAVWRLNPVPLAPDAPPPLAARLSQRLLTSRYPPWLSLSNATQADPGMGARLRHDYHDIVRRQTAGYQSVSTPLSQEPLRHPMDYQQMLQDAGQERDTPLRLRLPDARQMEDEDRESSRDLYRAVNRAIAGAFIGSGDWNLANNILDLTARIQQWPFDLKHLPDLTQTDRNVVARRCKLHNDASVSVSRCGTRLAALVCSNGGDSWVTSLHVISTRKEDLGTILYSKVFGPNAISVSLSPTAGHVIIGLASRRYLQMGPSQTIAQVFRLGEDSLGVESTSARSRSTTYRGELELIMNVDNQHQNADDPIFVAEIAMRPASVNCCVWMPQSGRGFAYATNKGHVVLATPNGQKSTFADSVFGDQEWLPHRLRRRRNNARVVEDADADLQQIL